MEEIAGSTFLKLDFTENDSIKIILKTLKGKKVDTVLSDMAPSYSGQNDVDHTRLMVFLFYFLNNKKKKKKNNIIFNLSQI
jgi:23S rRNA U2552 (ribose-2'-O)-methylase RlmE/FtsJ